MVNEILQEEFCEEMTACNYVNGTLTKFSKILCVVSCKKYLPKDYEIKTIYQPIKFLLKHSSSSHRDPVICENMIL